MRGGVAPAPRYSRFDATSVYVLLWRTMAVAA